MTDIIDLKNKIGIFISNIALHIAEEFTVELQKRKTGVLADTITACYKKLGNIEECDKSVSEAYRLISVAWKDFEENKARYMEPFYKYLEDYGLAEYIR